MPADKVGDPGALRLQTRVNGHLMQDAVTGQMFHSVQRIIAALSRGTTLLEGTIILTGSPAGVGHARTPPVYLKQGDVVEVEIAGVGRVRNPVRELP
jgi:2-keto-4-pentenoate hydratase/2-oxohepta-3-ene-1,7-dioic acid hydratase in catechol pathway